MQTQFIHNAFEGWTAITCYKDQFLQRYGERYEKMKKGTGNSFISTDWYPCQWRNNRSVDCRNFHKIQVPLYYIFTCKPQAILCCYCIVSYFPPDFREVHLLGQLSPYGDSPFLCLGGLCTHLCVFQGNYSLGSHVEFLYNLSGSFYPFLAMTRANCFFSSVCKPKCAFVIQFWQRTRCLICFSLWVPVGIKLYFFFPFLYI